MKTGLTFCGYLLAKTDVRHLWCEIAYKGVDARADFDYLADQGSVAWHVRDAYFDSTYDHLYIRGLSDAITIRLAFEAMGESYDVMAVFASISDAMDVNDIIISGGEFSAEDQFEFLGYDVSWGGPGFHSYLWQPGFLDRQPEQICDYWIKKLNPSGLLCSLEDAREFRSACLNVINDTMELMGVAILKLRRHEPSKGAPPISGAADGRHGRETLLAPRSLQRRDQPNQIHLITFPVTIVSDSPA